MAPNPRLTAALAAAGVSIHHLCHWLALLHLPPPQRMNRVERAGLLLIVESWRKHS